MINLPAWETFSKYDKKSLMAGIVVGQGLKGRARAPQTPTAAPAGFPQGLWDGAMERANAMIASIKGAAQSATPGTPNDWQFDKDAFCFGIAAGRSLEGWEIDGALNLPDGWAMIMYYVHVENPETVYVNIYPNHGFFSSTVLVAIVYIDWGDGNPPEIFTEEDGSDISKRAEHAHAYKSGDYIITIVSNCCTAPTHKVYVSPEQSGVYGSSDFYGATGFIATPLRGVYFAGNALNIDSGAFRDCRYLQDVTIMPGTIIQDYAFHRCVRLESIVIPDSTSIFQYAFQDCTGLRKHRTKKGSQITKTVL